MAGGGGVETAAPVGGVGCAGCGGGTTAVGAPRLVGGGGGKVGGGVSPPKDPLVGAVRAALPTLLPDLGGE